MAYAEALEKASGRKTAMPELGSETEGGEYSEAKETVAREAASALGLDPNTINAKAFCDALKKLIELE